MAAPSNSGLTNIPISSGADVGQGAGERAGGDADELAYGNRPFSPLDEGQIKGVIQREIEDALGGLGSELSEERRRAIQFYYGRPFGNEIEGRSTVVLEDVRDTIEWAMPSLMKMLFGGHATVRYEPHGEEDEADCELATDYINHLFYEKLDGFNMGYEWVKTCLLEKNGFIKPYMEERTEPEIRTLWGITEEEVDLLLSDDAVTALEQSDYMETLETEEGPVTMQFFDLKIRRLRKERVIRLDGIPPEEMLTARRLINWNKYEVPFVAQRRKVTVSDLISLGYDPEMVRNLPSDDTPEYEQARTERLSEDETFPVTTAERADPASRELWLTECYIKIDEDGDGFAELRRIVVVGESSITIIDDEEVSYVPFCVMAPIPMPHKFYGISLADLVMDLQLIRSTLLRQTLDNIYLTNNSRVEVVEGQVNVDDLMVSRPGGVVRVRKPGMVNPLQVPQVGNHAMGMMEFLEQVKENRTGITKYNQGQDSNSLNKTAYGMGRIMSSAYSRMELIAAVLAEGGKKQLFKMLLRIVVEGGMKPDMFKHKGKWIKVDPTSWNLDWGCTVKVGIGIGQESERIDMINTVLQIQEKAAQQGLSHMVTPKKFHNAFKDLTRAMGETNPTRYFEDPDTVQPPQPEPDPEMMKAQMEAQFKEQEIQIEAAKLDLTKNDNDDLSAFRIRELAQNLNLETAKLALDEDLRREELAMKERVELRKADNAIEIAKLQAAAQKAAAEEMEEHGTPETGQ